ncbi:MAG: hypothetical protein JSV91_07390 [Phycisphaerales bacterium]|nr:MAG: hypothetical protein JSV91_07390 [Phycisphaerales bacterium]
MHVLTKIFIVLVSLLAVLLVPLVVVYAQNEDTFKSKYADAVAQKTSAQGMAKAAIASHAAAEVRLQAQIDAAAAANRDLAEQLAAKVAEIRRLESELAAAKAMQAEIRKELAILASAGKANQELAVSLVDELRTLRDSALQGERQIVELDEANRELSGQLSVAVAARRALEEELQQVRDENAQALNTIGIYHNIHGPLSTDRMVATAEGIRPTQDLDATIISVRRGADNQVLAEIDAGSRDGVKVGWKMTIGKGGTFIGNLRIISVDINRSTGIVTLENELERGPVEVGQRVIARKGRD